MGGVVKRHARHLLSRMWAHPVKWFTYRGTALLVFAFTYAGMGASIVHTPSPPELFFTHWPLWVREAMWLGSAALAAAAAVFERPRWQSLGFAVLFIAPVERSLAYWIALFSTHNLRFMAGACVWACFALLIALIAAWPEPPEHAGLVEKAQAAA